MSHESLDIKDGKRIITLDSRKAAFLRLLCRDLSYPEIARKMGKSRRTVDGYRNALLVKLQVRSKTGLVLWCLKVGFIKPKDIKLSVYKRKSKEAI